MTLCQTLTHRGNPTVTLNFKTSTVCPYLFFTAIILLFFFIIFLLLFFLRLTARTIFLQFSLPVSRNSSTFMKLKGLIEGCREDQKLCELEKLRQLICLIKQDKKLTAVLKARTFVCCVPGTVL